VGWGEESKNKQQHCEEEEIEEEIERIEKETTVDGTRAFSTKAPSVACNESGSRNRNNVWHATKYDKRRH